MRRSARRTTSRSRRSKSRSPERRTGRTRHRGRRGGRAGSVSHLLEAGFGITPTRWFYGLFGLWLAQLFAFTPIACLI
ncbi:MAG: hypothetical protein ACXWCC_15995, partial [Caldimonas sp.]